MPQSSAVASPATPPPGPFFVVGADRSGTTMLRLMLNEHPRLHVPRESWFLIPLMNALSLDRELSPLEVETALRLITSHSRWQDWEVRDDELRRCVHGLEQPRLGDVVEAVFLLSAGRAGKQRWGDKTPEYVQEIDRLHQLFPDARFIHLIRDGRDVCRSLMKYQFRAEGLRDNARYWAHYVTAGMTSGRRLPTPLYTEVSYERLVLQTEAVLQELCRFLDVAYDPSMLHFHSHASENIAPWEQTIHRKTMRAPEPSDVGRWKKEMRALDVLRFEAIAGRTMDAAGQPLRYRGWLRPLPAMAGALERTQERAGRRLRELDATRRITKLARAGPSRMRLARGLEPLSVFWGEERGLPVCRYYAERFLEVHASSIRGRCLEFERDKYATHLGGKRVTHVDVVATSGASPDLTGIAGDLQGGVFDCIVCVFVLHCVREVERYVRELQSLLAPGGVLLVAVPHVSMCEPAYHELWRFTPAGLSRILGRVFGEDRVTVRAYGNSLTAAGQLRGLVTGEFTSAELDHHDDRFAVTVCAAASREDRRL